MTRRRVVIEDAVSLSLGKYLAEPAAEILEEEIRVRRVDRLR